MASPRVSARDEPAHGALSPHIPTAVILNAVNTPSLTLPRVGGENRPRAKHKTTQSTYGVTEYRLRRGIPRTSE